MTSAEIESLASSYLKEIHIKPITLDLLKPHQEQFFAAHLLPWNVSESNLEMVLKSPLIPGKEISYAQENFGGEDNEWYGEHKQELNSKLKQKIVDNIDLANFPNFFHKGITTNHTDLRRVPSYKPGFDTYEKAGEGFPFDYFQETSIWANTPVLLMHITKDRQWVYALSSFYKGWIPFNDLAIVDDQFITDWSSEPYSFVINDHFPMISEGGIHGMDARIGMVFPIANHSSENKSTVLFAVADENREGVLKKGFISNEHLQVGFQDISERQLKEMIGDILGQPYGWGGYLKNRDCSATIKDLLTPFGIWMPRNSPLQANHGELVGGKNHDVSTITDRKEKINFILEHGVPFLTVLWKKGHSMLYIGKNQKGEPLILHTIWGLKTEYGKSNILQTATEAFPIEGVHYNEKMAQFQGRRIIGKTVITTLTFDEVYHDLQSRLIDDIVKMAVLVPEKD